MASPRLRYSSSSSSNPSITLSRSRGRFSGCGTGNVVSGVRSTGALVLSGPPVRRVEPTHAIPVEADRERALRLVHVHVCFVPALDPNQQRETDLRHRLIRDRKGIDRLVAAYQEELIAIDELRDRTPELRQQEQALHRELQSAVDRAKDRETYLQLSETLTDILSRLRSSAEIRDIAEQQRIFRLLVKEILVTEDKITIRHSIPISGSPSGGPDPSKPGNVGLEDESYPFAFGASCRRFWPTSTCTMCWTTGSSKRQILD